MKTRKAIVLSSIILILLLSLACSISEETQPETVNAATKVALTVAAIDQPAEAITPQQPAASSESISPTAAPTPEPTLPPSTPTSLQSTLASLDSYRFIMTYHKNTKKPSDTQIIEITMDRSEDEDSTHSVYKLQNPIKLSDTDADTEPTTAEMWSKDSLVCVKNEDGEYETQEQTQNDTDNTKDLLDLLDIVPRIDNPEFVGAETVNGILSNHFKFKIANYMADSGWLVTRNEGEYWLAQDGQYIVKYSLYLDSSSAPEGNPKAEFMKIYIAEELQNINQAVDVTMPAACPPPSSD